MSQIALVADQHDHDIGVRMVPKLFQPPRDIVVGLVFADIVDEQGADGSTIVGGCDGSVSLLSRGIPDLCLDRFRVHLD